jgi:hypothetical protein
MLLTSPFTLFGAVGYVFTLTTAFYAIVMTVTYFYLRMEKKVGVENIARVSIELGMNEPGGGVVAADPIPIGRVLRDSIGIFARNAAGWCRWPVTRAVSCGARVGGGRCLPDCRACCLGSDDTLASALPMPRSFSAFCRF